MLQKPISHLVFTIKLCCIGMYSNVSLGVDFTFVLCRPLVDNLYNCNNSTLPIAKA